MYTSPPPALTRALAIAFIVSLAALARPAQAQVVWDGPMMMTPGAPAGWGLHLVEAHPGDAAGGLFTWRANPAPVGLGFRFGVTEGSPNGAALLGGVDVAGSVYSTSEDDFDLGVLWFAGAGLAVDDWTTISLPVGMSVGWAFQEENLAFRPYVAPRMVVDARFGDSAPEDEFDLGFALEVGVDFAFSQSFGIRAAGSFVDREALSLGITFPGFQR
jgi:hypothetical protein